MNATFSIFPRKRFYEESIDQNSYFKRKCSHSKLDSDRSRSDLKPDRVSIIVRWTLSLHDVCLNRLEPLKLRMMSCFLCSRFTPAPVASNSSIMSRCRVAPCHLSVVRYILIGHKNSMGLSAVNRKQRQPFPLHSAAIQNQNIQLNEEEE